MCGLKMWGTTWSEPKFEPEANRSRGHMARSCLGIVWSVASIIQSGLGLGLNHTV